MPLCYMRGVGLGYSCRHCCHCCYLFTECLHDVGGAGVWHCHYYHCSCFYCCCCSCYWSPSPFRICCACPFGIRFEGKSRIRIIRLREFSGSSPERHPGLSEGMTIKFCEYDTVIQTSISSSCLKVPLSLVLVGLLLFLLVHSPTAMVRSSMKTRSRRRTRVSSVVVHEGC